MALLLSLALGRAAARAGIPRVSVYLLVGLALGPHALLAWLDADGIAGQWLLGPASEAPLAIVERLAIGFILFEIGGAFRFVDFRRAGAGVAILAATEILCTALLVALAVFIGTGDWRLACIAPALAISSAPSATLVTLRELEAEGPTSRGLILCVGQNNLAALLAFPLLLTLAYGAGNAGTATLLAAAALVGGAVLGFLAAISLEAITGRRELVLLGILLVLVILGGIDWLGPEVTGLGMLGCFGAGIALANSSPHAEHVFRYVENTVYPLYVLFFIGAGRDLEIEAIGSVGILGILFIAARTLGKLGGTFLGLRVAGFGEQLPRYLGAGLMCQAGVALGLVSALEAATGAVTHELRQVVIASVVVFELCGPWLVRATAVRAGEVKFANLLPHSEARGLEAVRWVLIEIRRNLGLLRTTEHRGGDLRVAHAMRRRPSTIDDATPFERVLKTLSESANEQVPVVDAQGTFRGVISYGEVKNALYEPALRDLVVAGDLTSPIDDPLGPDDSLATALERMDGHHMHSWPVVADGRLVGMVQRSDLYSLLRRGAPAGRQ